MKTILKTKTKIAVALVIIFSWSCERKNVIDSVVPSFARQSVTIEKAQQWLKNHLEANDVRKYDGILWDLAENTNSQDIPILTVPFFDVDDNTKVLRKHNGVIEEIDISAQRLIFFEDENNSIQSFILEVDNPSVASIK